MIETLFLFRPLNQKLIALLTDLSRSDWERKTVAGNWTVKDVAAHLLDGNVRSISIYRDLVESQPEEKINSYLELVSYLNRLNADWVKAMKRMSPAMLVEWLKATHEEYVACLENLEPDAPAKFSVAWAGDEVSPNWFHSAREFTEKWHHQQQIRNAVEKPGILTKEFYRPVLATFMRALPYKYKDVSASPGTRICISINDMGDPWVLEKRGKQWELLDVNAREWHVKLEIPAEISWKLFTNAIKYEDVKNFISIDGEKHLALPALHMVTVMA
jgi:uncharacterized protein (TIGR03083 family)